VIRSSAVAGTFYSADAETLRRSVQGFLSDAPQCTAVGAVVPHAGYLYSGAVAGEVYSHIRLPEVCVILSPNHTGRGAEASIMCRGSWETPLGKMVVDEALALAILERSQLMQEDSAAHLREHSVEVQLPFLQVLGTTVFVPITLMALGFKQCAAMAEDMAGAIRESGRSVVLIASSDMTHYESHDAATRKDRLALDRVEALDPQGLYETVRQQRISMCGVIPTTIMLLAAKALGATRARTVRYATSGEVSGDFAQVVGYAGVIVE
jgi:AmmeMemoRadiSam system protein B